MEHQAGPLMGAAGALSIFAIFAALFGGAYAFRGSLSIFGRELGRFAPAVTVLLAALAIYGTGQVQELLWIAVGEHLSSKFPEYPGLGALVDHFYAASLERGPYSILLAAVALGLWTPIHYMILYMSRGPVNEASAWKAFFWSAAVGWVAASVFLTIASYNILEISFPKLQSSETVWACIGAFLLFLILPLLALSVVGSIGHFSMLPAWGLAIGVSIFLGLLIVSCVLAVLAFPIGLAGGAVWNFNGELLDGLVLTNLFLAGILGWTSLIIYAERMVKLPIIGLALALIFVLSIFDLNDNHRIHEVLQPAGGGQQKPSSARPSLEDTFANWYASRPDRDQFKDGYPVYLIAAQGGGLYAAYHAAQFLARTQDRYPGNPSFSEHVFAISAVSGGSLGASVFVSLLNAKPAATDPPSPPESLSSKARKILSQDLLSPLLGASLFADLPARLLPCTEGFCPGRVLDRALALERSIESAWDAGARGFQAKNPFAESFYADWESAKDGPALLFNTTEVETGERVVISPFKLKPGSTQLSALADRTDIDLALSTAAVLSARFPGVTPAGWYMPKGTTEKRRLVDGGYFDNSGVATAMDVIVRLEKLQLSPRPRFILIALAGAEEGGEADAPSHYFGEILSPLRTLDSVRSSRGLLAIKQAQILMNGSPCSHVGRTGHSPCNYKANMRMLVLASGDQRLPLGWQLSERSRLAIERSIGDPLLCKMLLIPVPSPDMSAREQVAQNVRRHNSCLLAAIGADLHASR